MALTRKMEMDELDQALAEFDEDNAGCPIGRFVVSATTISANYRASQGIDKRMDDAVRAVNCKYNPEDCDLLDGANIYMGVTNLKVRAFRSWLSDILLNSEDKPWTLRPSPIPELPIEVEDKVIDMFMEEVAERGYTGGVETRLSELKRIARIHVDRVAAENAMNMENLVHDQLTEGGWREAFDAFIDDLGTHPVAILKGPHVAFEPRLEWGNDGAKVVEKTIYKTTRVSPYDFFPSPDSRCVQSGAYVVERMSMTSQQLLASAAIPGFREAEIRTAMHNFADGWSWNLTGTNEDNDEGAVLAERPHGVAGNYDVLVYYGRVRGEMLHEWDVGVLDPQREYEVELWVTGHRAIRAILNPYPLRRRPFYATSFDKDPSSFWGKGLPCLLADIQRVANATVRALVKNMAYSAGPIGEVDVSRLAVEGDISEVQPYRIYAVDADQVIPAQQAAFRFHNIQSNAGELMGIYERFMKQADDVSGIPAYVLGNPQVAGAGRTLGGLSLLMGNAAKGIKKVISHVDKDVIEPLTERYVNMNNLYGSDSGVRFDTVVVARGSAGLLQRELSQSRATELIGLLVPMVQQGQATPEGLNIVLRDVIRGLGYRADEIAPALGRSGDIANFLGSTQPGTPQPALDNRSAVPTGP